MRKIFKIIFGFQGEVGFSKSKGALWHRDEYFIHCNESNK
jgi:hypothetical protein